MMNSRYLENNLLFSNSIRYLESICFSQFIQYLTLINSGLSLVLCATSEFNVNLSSIYDEGAKETNLAIEGSEIALSSCSLDMVQERTLLELQDLFEKLMRDAYEIGLDQSSPPYSQRGRLVQILCRMQIFV